MDIQELEKELGYNFKDRKLLETAITHTSYAHEHKCVSYERLEFLGDAVLQLLMSEYIFKKFPNYPEGKMSRLRANIVCETSLFQIAEKYTLDKAARLGHGEELMGGRKKPSILADMVEAIIAAIYLDGGEDEAKKLIFVEFKDIIEEAVQGKLNTDYKTALQEKVQIGGHRQPEYKMLGETGPAHAKTFFAEVCIDGKACGSGEGRTKQEAQQMAAKAALEDRK